MMKRAVGLSVLLCLLGLPALGAGEMNESPWERVGVSLGGVFAFMKSDVRIGSDALGTGIEVNVEEALNLDRSVVSWRLEGFYRLKDSPRHRFDLGIYEFRRSSTKVLESDIIIGEKEFLQGTKIESFFQLSDHSGGV